MSQKETHTHIHAKKKIIKPKAAEMQVSPCTSFDATRCEREIAEGRTLKKRPAIPSNVVLRSIVFALVFIPHSARRFSSVGQRLCLPARVGAASLRAFCV